MRKQSCQFKNIKLVFLILLIVMFSCQKAINFSSDKRSLHESISVAELNQWVDWYVKSIPNGPQPDLSRLKKTYTNGEMILKIPLSSGGGAFYLVKNKNKVEACFIRKVGPDLAGGGGYIELINMQSFKYAKFPYNNQLVKLENDNLSASSSTNTEPIIKSANNYYEGSWFGALLYCIGKYIFAIPKREGGGWSCYGLGGSGQNGSEGGDNQSILPPDDNGGGFFDWDSWFLNYFPANGTLNPNMDYNWYPFTGNGLGGQTNYNDYGIEEPVNPNDPFDPSFLNAIASLASLDNPPFDWFFTGDDGTTFEDLNPSIEPLIEFDQADKDYYELNYPAFTSIVRNLKYFVKNNPTVFKALQVWSGFSKQEIIEKLTYKAGTGLKIKIGDVGDNYGRYNHKDFPNVLFVDQGLVAELERTVLKRHKDALAFLIAATVLHEFCHFGGNVNQLKNTGKFKFQEEGFQFEYIAFDVIVNKTTAGQIYLNFKIRY